ncbi:unnamed protein product, partial [Ectocarpus fasciculatus]
NRLVPIGGGAAGMKKLRGTVARERRERTRLGTKDRYLEEAVRRNHRAVSHDHDRDDDASTSCSVATFEDFYLKSTQAADALPVVEGRMNAEEPTGAPMEARPQLAIAEEAAVAAALPSEEAMRKEQRREERRAERRERLELKREQARRRATSLDGSSSSISTAPLGGEMSLDGGPPSGEILVLLPRRKTGGGGGVGDLEDDASLDPSVSSLGTYDERSRSGSGGGGAPGNLQSLEEPTSATATGGGGGGRLPVVPMLHPPAADLGGEGRRWRRPRRRSRLAVAPPAPPSPTDASASAGGGVQSAAVSCSSSFVPTDGGALAEERERTSRLGIAFGGASKRRRSRGGGGGGGSIGARGAAEAASDPATSGSSTGGQPLAPATIPAVGIDGNGTSTGATVAPTAALLKGKINGWRRRGKAAPTVPPPIPASAAPLVDADRQLPRVSSRDSISPDALLPLLVTADGDSSGGRALVARDAAPAAAATLPPPTALIPVKVGTMDGERMLSESLSSMTSLAGSTRVALPSGTIDSGTVSGTVSGTPTLGSKAEGSAAGGSSATEMATATAAPIAGGVPGMGQAGAGVDGGGGGGGAAARGRHDGGEPTMARKNRRSGRTSGANTGSTQRVHKINLGSKRHQMSMTCADRTALLIGACEWGDLEALQRLLELG